MLVEVVQQVLVITKLGHKDNFSKFTAKLLSLRIYIWPGSKKGGDYVDGGDTDILNAALGEGEGDVEGGSDEHVGRRHQDISQAHVSALPMVTEFSFFSMSC